jgi:hypothetical protein
LAGLPSCSWTSDPATTWQPRPVNDYVQAVFWTFSAIFSSCVATIWNLITGVLQTLKV